MFNRYVDGLATWAPTAWEDYEVMGARTVEDGYPLPPRGVQAWALSPTARGDR